MRFRTKMTPDIFGNAVALLLTPLCLVADAPARSHHPAKTSAIPLIDLRLRRQVAATRQPGLHPLAALSADRIRRRRRQKHTKQEGKPGKPAIKPEFFLIRQSVS